MNIGKLSYCGRVFHDHCMEHVHQYFLAEEDREGQDQKPAETKRYMEYHISILTATRSL